MIAKTIVESYLEMPTSGTRKMPSIFMYEWFEKYITLTPGERASLTVDLNDLRCDLFNALICC